MERFSSVENRGGGLILGGGGWGGVRNNSITYDLFRSLSLAPNAGQDKAGRLDFPHFAIQAARGENAENAAFTRRIGF